MIFFPLKYRVNKQYDIKMNAILSTFIKLPFVIKTFILSIVSCPFTQVLL